MGIRPDYVRHLPPLPKQTLTDNDRDRLANLGNNVWGVSGLWIFRYRRLIAGCRRPWRAPAHRPDRGDEECFT